MLSINQKKYIHSLQQKKYRNQYGAFIVEGEKMVNELIQTNFEIESIFVVKGYSVAFEGYVEISEKEMKSISSLTTPSRYLAVVKQKLTSISTPFKNLTLILDNIKDPGNLGTIIRTADWFGVQNIICSNECVDCFNPKVVQATMGSIFRLNIIYTDLVEFLSAKNTLPVYGALLVGENIYEKPISGNDVVILIGSESFGISNNLIPFVNQRVKIPSFGKAESLNVAVATGILCSAYQQHLNH